MIAEDGTHLTYAELWDRATRVAGFLAAEGIGAGDVVSVQLPNQLDTAVVALGVLAAGAVVNPLLPNYRARELAHVFTTARPRAIFTPAVHRDFDHEELVTATDERNRLLAGARRVRSRPAPRDCAGRRARARRPRRAPGRSRRGRGLRAHLHLGHRGDAQGHHAHRADHQLQRARRGRGSRGHRRRRRVDAVATRPQHRVQLRAAVRAVPRPPAGAAGPVGPRRSRSTSSAASGARTRSPPPRSCGSWWRSRRDGALPSTRLWCFGCGGAPVPPALVEEGEAHGVQVLRLYGSTEVLVATWNRPDAPCDAHASTPTGAR